VLEGLESVAPIMALLDAEVAAAEARAALAADGARDHASRADRVHREVRAMLDREQARWTAAQEAIERDDTSADELAAALGINGAVTSREAFDALMTDPSGVLRLGPPDTATAAPHRSLARVARAAERPPLGPSETATLLMRTGAPSSLCNAAGTGACVRGADGDAVLLGDGTFVCVDEQRYMRTKVADAAASIGAARRLTPSRLASEQPPTLLPSARAAFAACLHARRATAIPAPQALGPYVLWGAAVSGQDEQPSDIRTLWNLVSELRRSGGDADATAAALLMMAYVIFRVRARAGAALEPEALADAQAAIDVGRVRWCRLSDTAVFWLPLMSTSPDQVGGADRPWTLDIPSAGAAWHAQSPALSLDPAWHARLVIVPGHPDLWCVETDRTWWNLDTAFEAVLESRRAHIQAWLAALETFEHEVPERVERLKARAREATRSKPQKALTDAEAPTRRSLSNEPPRFSNEWVLDRAARYAYDDDAAPRAAGARAARSGSYSYEDFLCVVRWKSARAVPRAERNAPEAVRVATAVAFAAPDDITRMVELTVLDGVGVPVASALLHFAFPDRFPILDFRALHSLGDTKRRTQYSAAFWADYVQRCQRLARDAGVSIRDLDKALWQDSREAGPGGR
jgi:hypothetical protein